MTESSVLSSPSSPKGPFGTAQKPRTTGSIHGIRSQAAQKGGIAFMDVGQKSEKTEKNGKPKCCVQPVMTKSEIKSVSRVISRFLHLVRKREREDFCEAYCDFWDATCISGVFPDHSVTTRFAVRAFDFLSDHLDLLPHLDGSQEIALTDYLLRLIEQLQRCFNMYYKVMGIAAGEDYAVKPYLPFILSGDVHKLLKYQTCVFWNIHLDSLEEEFPVAGIFEGVPLFFGERHGKEFLGRMKRNRFVQYSTFQGFKKCLPPLPLPKIMEAFDDLESDLTKEPGPFSEKRLRRYVDQLTKGSKCSKPQLSYSLGASYIMGRKAGGQLAELLRAYNAYRYRNNDSLSVYEITPRLRGWTLQEGIMTSTYLEGPTIEEVRDFWFQRVAFGFTVDEWYKKNANAQPLGILEPLKVRIITKGDAFTLCGLHHVKDDLRRVLRKVPNGIFDLIFDSLDSSTNWGIREFWSKKDPDCGSMLDLKHWDSRILDGDVPETVLGKTFWCSGDYSAATNKCNGEISSFILSRFMSNLGYDAEIAWRAQRSLLGNNMHFDPQRCLPWDAFGFKRPEEFDLPGRSYIQTNGQLMGSVISFPVLCMMNLFAYWEAVERYTGRILTLHELVQRYPLRINGDDILFATNRSFYDCWSDVIQTYGFEKSQGKNLLLEDAFTINSVYYTNSPQFPDVVKAIPYINFGFLNGVKKGDGTNDTVSRATQLGPQFEEYSRSRPFWESALQGYTMLKQAPGSYADRAQKVFFETYTPYLEDQGWTPKEFELNHARIRKVPVPTERDCFFPHPQREDEKRDFWLDSVYEQPNTPQDVHQVSQPVKLDCHSTREETPIEWPLEEVLKERTRHAERELSNLLAS